MAQKWSPQKNYGTKILASNIGPQKMDPKNVDRENNHITWSRIVIRENNNDVTMDQSQERYGFDVNIDQSEARNLLAKF